MNGLRRRIMAGGTPPPTLEVSPDTLTLAWDGNGTYIVNVTSNTTWDVDVT